MIEKTVVIRNKAGIHCRPSSAIIGAASQWESVSFLLKTSKGNVTLNSILNLLTLGLQCGESVTVCAEGPDEEKACNELADLFAFEFDFPPVK